MKPAWIIFGTLALIAVLLGGAAKGRRPGGAKLTKHWSLEAKRPVLSERERELFRRLRESLPAHLVLAQVQLVQMLNFECGRRTQALFNRICQLSVDFVVLNPDTNLAAAIKLDDATHDRADRRSADARKTHTLESAGVRLIRWNAKSLPSHVEILKALSPRAVS